MARRTTNFVFNSPDAATVQRAHLYVDFVSNGALVLHQLPQPGELAGILLVAIGVALGVLLSRPVMRLKSFYRVLLVP